MSGWDRAFAMLDAKERANRSFYANTPTAPDSRQVRRRAARKAAKAAARRIPRVKS